MSQNDWGDLIDSIKSTAKMQKIGPKMAIFGPIWTQFRSKQLKIQPGSHIWSTWLDSIDCKYGFLVESLNREYFR